jgi:hypothetical protein
MLGGPGSLLVSRPPATTNTYTSSLQFRILAIIHRSDLTWKSGGSDAAHEVFKMNSPITRMNPTARGITADEMARAIDGE